MFRFWSVALVFVATGCEQLGLNEEPVAAGVGSTVGGDPVPAADPLPGDVEVFNDPVVPAPADWDGDGILAKAENTDNAPAWSRIEAEVVSRDGVRYLLGTGVAQGIDNPGLAQKTAENRARHVLAHYLDKNRLVASHIVGSWQDAATGAFYARAEIEVPETFMPGGLQKMRDLKSADKPH